MATIRKAVEKLTRDGVAPTYTGSLSTSDDYAVNNDGRVFLHLKKSGAGACTVTIETVLQLAGLEVDDATASVPASTGDRVIGPFPPATFNDENGDMKITFSNVTGLTFAALKI